MKVYNLCFEISILCEKYDAKRWGNSFKQFAEKLKTDSPKDVLRQIYGLYGGMGSFNDLVLQRNGVVDHADNKKLDILRQQLFEEITVNLKKP